MLNKFGRHNKTRVTFIFVNTYVGDQDNNNIKNIQNRTLPAKFEVTFSLNTPRMTKKVLRMKLRGTRKKVEQDVRRSNFHKEKFGKDYEH